MSSSVKRFFSSATSVRGLGPPARRPSVRSAMKALSGWMWVSTNPGRTSLSATSRVPPPGHTRVVDLTRARSGPTAVRQLADMGAQVVRVEAREEMEGDSTALGFDFLNLHRNKRALTLDLKHPRGLEVLRRLAAQADVDVENFRPDVKRRLGIDYEALARP